MSTEQITIRLPVERVASLRANAKAQHRSLAQEVEHALSEGDRDYGFASLNAVLEADNRTLTDRCAELESENAELRNRDYTGQLRRAVAAPPNAPITEVTPRLKGAKA